MAEPAQKKTKCERAFLFSPESMNEGHPGKLCDPTTWHELDEGSDAVLDTCLRQDPERNVDCDTTTKDDMVTVTGEIRAKRIGNFEEERLKEEEETKKKKKHKKHLIELGVQPSTNFNFNARGVRNMTTGWRS